RRLHRDEAQAGGPGGARLRVGGSRTLPEPMESAGDGSGWEADRARRGIHRCAAAPGGRELAHRDRQSLGSEDAGVAPSEAAPVPEVGLMVHAHSFPKPNRGYFMIESIHDPIEVIIMLGNGK